MKIMVTGASGGYGRFAMEYLKDVPADVQIIALVRDPSKGKELEDMGFEVRIGDYSDLGSMKRAFIDIDRLLFVSVPVTELQKNVVEAIKDSNIEYVVYTSLFSPQYSKFGLEENHRKTEKMIAEAGVKHTFLRNSWYIDMNGEYLKASAENGVYPYLSDDAVITWALKREYAEAGAKTILHGSDEEIVELSNRPVTYKQMGESLKEAVGKDIDLVKVDKDGFESMLRGYGVSDIGIMLPSVYQQYAIAGKNGENEGDPSEFEKILGHPLTHLTDAIRETISKEQWIGVIR